MKIKEIIDHNSKIINRIKHDTHLDDLTEIANVFETFQSNNEELYKTVNELSLEEIALLK